MSGVNFSSSDIYLGEFLMKFLSILTCFVVLKIEAAVCLLVWALIYLDFYSFVEN